MMPVYIVVKHNDETVAVRRVFSLTKAVQVCRYLTAQLIAEVGSKQVYKQLGFKVNVVQL